MTIPIASAAGSHTHQGRTYDFCAASCLDRFRRHPERYLEPHPPRGASAAAGDQRDYTCPMHPEIVRDEPGACPICGMALEPRTVAAVEEKNPELVSMTRRLRVSAALSAPILLLMLAELLPGQPLHQPWVDGPWHGSSSCWPPRWCCGAAGHSSSAAGARSSTATSTCSR